MKTRISSICGATLLLASWLWVNGLNAAETPKAKQASPEFERMKSLVGTWTGKTEMGRGRMDLTVRYRLLAGGSVLEEKVFEGTRNEMTIMYFEQGGKLALTHYCMLGNRPGMLLKSSDEKSLTFDFDKTCGIDAKTESHMHAMTITFDDADTVTCSCKAFMDGKEMPEHPTTLKRVKT